ncbi:hypothetical protein ORI20_12920 [Mycobacterium sp. CVI_P3]|uniref:Uncharacterized protein n=1 Tax=Mycobacterium pinniadriaticum TaxID=2994102 RepID=A0ABT3SDJ8_9MYCO|nr:hypothetical protein [Mycobacterium pinniadriaticum]MCX2931185.1 hypothetical protein [Mycobacterium pinniadriaticum]MCX2937591.1 hypothetical protein [Mycobacterium pinniadriaticum]
MAMQIRSEFELPTLQILLDPQRTNFSEAVFRVLLGTQTPDEVARCSLGDLGLPAAMTGLNPVDDHNLSIPAEVVEALQRAAGTLGRSPLPPQDALWLEFPSPRGSLYIMPWERILAPLGRPLIRLPNHLVRPQAPGDALEVAICATTSQESSTLKKLPDILDHLVAQYLQHAASRAVTVHIFTDPSWFGAVQKRLDAYGDSVVLHDPAGAVGYDPRSNVSNTGSAVQISSPWLLWMRDNLGTRPFDWVHFVGPGYLAGDRGALAVATSPVVGQTKQGSRSIGPGELNTFLSQVGAWGLGLSGPLGGSADVGLRELADAVTLMRPCVTIEHCLDVDPASADFGTLLETVFRPGSALNHPVPAVTCWAHPQFVQYPDDYRYDLGLNTDGSSAFVSELTKAALAQSDTPTWIASASRVMESQQMRWLPNSADVAADPAAVTALQNVADLIERHVGQTFPQRLADGGEP